MTKEKLIEKYIELSKLYYEKFAIQSEEPRIINRIALRISKIAFKIQNCENFLEIYYEILLQHPEYIGAIAIKIREFEPDLTKKMYQKFYDIDREKNWKAKFVLNHRDRDVEADKIRADQEQLAKYEKRKEENPEEFTEIYNKINDFVDSL